MIADMFDRAAPGKAVQAALDAYVASGARFSLQAERSLREAVRLLGELGGHRHQREAAVISEFMIRLALRDDDDERLRKAETRIRGLFPALN